MMNTVNLTISILYGLNTLPILINSLGFEYHVIVYDDIEVKIFEWDENKCFE